MLFPAAPKTTGKSRRVMLMIVSSVGGCSDLPADPQMVAVDIIASAISMGFIFKKVLAATSDCRPRCDSRH
jgi:hypothetical protein